MDASLSKLLEILKDRGARCAASHGVKKSQTRLSDWPRAPSSITELCSLYWIPDPPIPALYTWCPPKDKDDAHGPDGKALVTSCTHYQSRGSPGHPSLRNNSWKVYFHPSNICCLCLLFILGPHLQKNGWDSLPQPEPRLSMDSSGSRSSSYSWRPCPLGCPDVAIIVPILSEYPLLPREGNRAAL